MVFEQGKSKGQVSTKSSALITGASDIEFAYMVRNLSTGAIKWKSEWTDLDVLPSRVRLSLGFDGEDVAFDFELKNVMAPGCLMGGSLLGCEARQ